MAVGWNQGSRVNMLRRKLADMGVELNYSAAEFSEILQQYINELSESPEKEAARRFYIEQDLQKKNPDTGRPLTADYRFYQFLSSFRFALADYLRRTHGRAVS